MPASAIIGRMANLRIALKVLGTAVTVEGPVPDGPARLDEMLPFMRKLDDEVISAAVRHVEASGQSVSCQRGCSTCCRAQPVPVTPVEAHALERVVEAMPEPRRSLVKERFVANVRRLEEAGLAEHYRQRDPALSAEDARTIAERYFRLGLVCPFLEDDACGIYNDRPFVCRQYLVTSPAQLCQDPFHEPVRLVPIPLTPATATLAVSERVYRTPQYTMPLALSLEYAASRASELQQRADPRDVLPRWIQASAST